MLYFYDFFYSHKELPQFFGSELHEHYSPNIQKRPTTPTSPPRDKTVSTEYQLNNQQRHKANAFYIRSLKFFCYGEVIPVSFWRQQNVNTHHYPSKYPLKFNDSIHAHAVPFFCTKKILLLLLFYFIICSYFFSAIFKEVD